MMPILSFPRGRLQAGDQIVFHIHTHVSFITVEIFHMMDISALLIFGRFLAFDPPFCIWVTRTFATVLSALIFGHVYIVFIMNTRQRHASRSII